MSHFSRRLSQCPSFRLSVSAALAAGLLSLSACNKAAQTAQAPQAMELKVQELAYESVTLSKELPGRLSPLRIAEVRARISGIVQKRHFKEGSDVKEGDLLFEIDPAPYQAALDSARASLARAEANLASNQAQASRYKGLVETNAVSKQAFDNAVAAELSSKADVLAARAAVSTAEINLGYTRVTSPITGRIGRASVTEGAYVQQGTATLMAVVQQLDPLYVDLNQTAEEVLKLKQALASGRLVRSADGGLRLTLSLTNGVAYAQTGSLEFSEVTVNQGTGTVTLRGTIPNPNNDLLPGMFVRARVDEGLNPQALLVSQSLVRRNSKGQGTVYVVSADSKVEQRVIETADSLNGRWLITAGLKPGDLLILENLQKIRPGMPVKPLKASTAAAAPAAPAPTSAPAPATH